MAGGALTLSVRLSVCLPPHPSFSPQLPQGPPRDPDSGAPQVAQGGGRAWGWLAGARGPAESKGTGVGAPEQGGGGGAPGGPGSRKGPQRASARGWV